MNTPVAPTPVDTSANPYNSMISSDGAASNAIEANNTQVGNTITQQETQAAGGGYPAMANDFGLGTASQSTPVAGSASNPSFGSQPISVTMPDTSSRGFNPWSLTGEANARSGK